MSLNRVIIDTDLGRRSVSSSTGKPWHGAKDDYGIPWKESSFAKEINDGVSAWVQKVKNTGICDPSGPAPTASVYVLWKSPGMPRRIYRVVSYLTAPPKITDTLELIPLMKDIPKGVALSVPASEVEFLSKTKSAAAHRIHQKT